MLVIYSAEVVECTGYQKNILDICSSVDIPLTKGLHFATKIKFVAKNLNLDNKCFQQS